MSREIKYNKEARKKLKVGADKLANAVKVTLGAKGRNVIIEKDYAPPYVTKDGVTVANDIELPDPIENMGAQMVREAAGKAAKDAGDGTTTSTILAQALINESLKIIDNLSMWDRLLAKQGVNPMDIKRGIDKGVIAVVNRLSQLSEEVSHDNDRIRQIATISANGDEEIGQLIANAMKKVTSDGIITPEESKGTNTFVDVVEGLRFVNGLMHPVFVTNPKKIVGEYEDVNIVFYSGKINTAKQIVPIIEMGLNKQKPLVIVAHDFDGDVVLTFAKNKKEKGFDIIPVKAPAYGELRRDMMEDLAIFTGGTNLTEEKNIKPEKFTEDMFGQASKIIISKEDTTIVGNGENQEAVNKRIEELKHQIDDTSQEFDDSEIKGRIAKLKGGIAIIYVGANTEVEMNEKKDRVDDALEATKSAVQEGVVAGGGVALLEASRILEDLKGDNKDQSKGIEILRKAIISPLRQIALNSGLDPDYIAGQAFDLGYPMGYDVKEGGFNNLLKQGVIDPKKVTRVALESAASIATLIITSEATINIIKNKN
jgi:chaperonin GroEL